MPRRRSSSRSDSRRRKKSPPRKSRRRDSRSRSRDRGRGGRSDRGGRGGDSKADSKPAGKVLPEWGTVGVVMELKTGGIGFIRPDSGKVDDKDLFFHKSALQNSSFDELTIGDEVTYEAQLDESKGKAAAKNVVVKMPGRGDRRR
eukprot:gb/GFBE01056194.1/.p1 GENE.gb/GFBE01056194.1/~~gb/GFBE01056194.1/.p1  ORF type:complete len:145 (+),score=16.52 gb/GFBE01056194.1/:1-435(+)